MEPFRPTRGGGVRAALAPAEASLLRSLVGQVITLIAPDGPPQRQLDDLLDWDAPADQPETPDDPVLARLLPGFRQQRTPPVHDAAASLSDGRFVEVAGIEPASFSASPGLLRAQLAALFSAPAITQARRRQAQPLFDVPPGPAAGSGGNPSS